MIDMKHLALLSLVTILSTGCVVGRSVIEAPTTPNVKAPNSGFPIVLAETRDHRIFFKGAMDLHLPSVDQVDESLQYLKAVTIGRKRNAFGKKFGGVILPNFLTVTKVVEDVVISAMHKAGYKIVPANSTEGQTAPVLTIEVNEFWAWFENGGLTASIKQRSDVLIIGEFPGFADGVNTRIEVEDSIALALNDAFWTDIINKGLIALEEKLERDIPKPPG